ncbi:MAG: hypothetical protein M1825_005811 [Sarcosagium campestre]|nr:MAG: hypothetical protein M1825_005811 [Sarcosagium campestre]
MGERSAFFYGTLMSSQVLHRVCPSDSLPQSQKPSRFETRVAILHHHCRRKVRYADYPAVTPSRDDSVRGTFVTGLTENDIRRLDVFEGSEYKRSKVRVRLVDASGEELPEEVDAETYIWYSGVENLEDGEWDFEHFCREKLRFWAGPAARAEEFEEVDMLDVDDQQVADPTRGRGVNGHVLKQFDDGVGEKQVSKSAV